MTIRTLFLPEKIRSSYYVFTQRIAACEISHTRVKIALVKAYGYKRTIEQIVEVSLGEGAMPEPEKATQALADAFSQLGRFDDFYVVLSSNMVIFKELIFPFTSLEKIKLILPFEVEQFLPFALSEATVDGIVTRVEGTTATVLAVAIRNDVLADYLKIFQQAGVEPTKVTVDLVELYSLYKALGLQESAKNALLFYMDLYTTRLGVIVDTQLKATRLLSQGLVKLARDYNSELDQFLHSHVAVLEVPQGAALFFDEVRFTLEAFNASVPEGEKLQKIFLMGLGADVQGLPELIEKMTQIPCEIIGTSLILQKGIALVKSNHGIPNRALLSVSAALALPQSTDFNLYVEHELGLQDKLMNRQFIVAGTFLLLTLGALLVNGWLTARNFKKAIKASEQEAVAKLKKSFPAVATRIKSNSLDLVVNAARQEVARERAIWFALSTQNRASFLFYLQELSTRLDPDGLGLMLSRLILTDDSLTLEGRVKGYDALKQLEEDLRRSKLFVSVPRQQELTFTIKLVLDKKAGDHA